MAQIEAMMQTMRNANMTLQQQQQEAMLRTITTNSGQHVQMERLIGVSTDQVRVFTERVKSELGGRQGCWQTECLPER